MNILMTEPGLHWNGQQQRLLREALWLDAHGHRVTIVCAPQSALAERLEESSLSWRPMSLCMFTGAVLLRLAQDLGVDIIHTRQSKDTACALWAKSQGLRVVRSRHQPLPGKLCMTQRWLYRHGCDRVVAASQSIRQALIHTGDVPSDRIEVIGEGVRLEEFHPSIDGASLRRQWGIDPSAPLFGVIGMIRKEKGLCAFVDAALELRRQVPRARFVLVGDGHGYYAERLRERIGRAFPGSRPALILAGFRRDIPRVTAALDALVVPSITDGQTLVIPQAFACGKPVIASDVGGIPEIVEHGKTGLLVPPNKPRDLAMTMRHLLDDPMLARELARAGHEFAKLNLSFADRMKDLLRTYECALGPRSSDFSRGNRVRPLASSPLP